MDEIVKHKEPFKNSLGIPLQLCPRCQGVFGALPGGRDAVCTNCGYKDPCCE